MKDSATQLLKTIKNQIGDHWEKLEEEDKVNITRFVSRLIELEAKQQQDIEELKVIKAALANWKTVGAIKSEIVVNGILEAIKETGIQTGSQLLATLLKEQLQ